MLYREIKAVCSQIHTKHINTLCGQNVELLNVKLVEYRVTTGLYKVKKRLSQQSNKFFCVCDMEVTNYDSELIIGIIFMLLVCP